jgi:uncharacterized protein (DUF4415 family)
MSVSKRLIDAKGEVRELSLADIQSMRTASEVLPQSVLTKLRTRGPQKTPTKERITIRLSPEVLTPFRASGQGWQSRIDDALRDWLKKNSVQHKN